jgi:hypothetical protein
MTDEHTLTLHQADQARTDFALIEDQLEFIMGQLSRMPTRGVPVPDAAVGDGEHLGAARGACAADNAVNLSIRSLSWLHLSLSDCVY